MQLPAAHGTSLFQILSVWIGGTEAVILQNVAPAFPKSSVCELLGQKPSAFSTWHLIFPHSQLCIMGTQRVALQHMAPHFPRILCLNRRNTSTWPTVQGTSVSQVLSIWTGEKPVVNLKHVAHRFSTFKCMNLGDTNITCGTSFSQNLCLIWGDSSNHAIHGTSLSQIFSVWYWETQSVSL